MYVCLFSCVICMCVCLHGMHGMCIMLHITCTCPLQPSGTGKCESLYEFEGVVADGELRFGPGETITTLEKVDEDWMRGRIGNMEGIFPVAFVKIIAEIPPKTKPSSPIKKAALLKPATSSG